MVSRFPQRSVNRVSSGLKDNVSTPDRPHQLFGNDHFRDIRHVPQAVLPPSMPLQERLVPLFALLPRLITALEGV